MSGTEITEIIKRLQGLHNTAIQLNEILRNPNLAYREAVLFTRALVWCEIKTEMEECADRLPPVIVESISIAASAIAATAEPTG